MESEGLLYGHVMGTHVGLYDGSISETVQYSDIQTTSGNRKWPSLSNSVISNDLQSRQGHSHTVFSNVIFFHTLYTAVADISTDIGP